MDQGPVKIFSAGDTPRLRYIAEIIFGDILGLSFDIITDRRKLGRHPVINYSTEALEGAFTIRPEGLLSEKGVCIRNIGMGTWHNLPVFFQQTALSDLPFDIFAASFYLVTRYEEYLPAEYDEHGRFKSSDSLAYKNSFLMKPLIDLWADEFARSLLQKFPFLVFRRREFASLATFDTDKAFEYLGRDLFGSFNLLLNDNGAPGLSFRQRYRVITREEKDPLDVFDYIIEIIESSYSDTRFFFPVGDRSVFDQNPAWRNNDYRVLIKNISGRFPSGLHPSYKSGHDGNSLVEESARLKTITSNDVFMSRFHYLRFRFPDSFNSLIHSGISEDYSIGYGDEPGFRASIARPFFFYNLIEDYKTKLRLIPFQVMDCTLKENKGLTPEQSVQVINELINTTRQAGGLFVSIWHNTTLTDTVEGKKWRQVFETALSNQKP